MLSIVSNTLQFTFIHDFEKKLQIAFNMYLGSSNVSGFDSPYELVNSVKDNHLDKSDSISKYILNEDEFTGDAVPGLDNTDINLHTTRVTTKVTKS